MWRCLDVVDAKTAKNTNASGREHLRVPVRSAAKEGAFFCVLNGKKIWTARFFDENKLLHATTISDQDSITNKGISEGPPDRT